jgi:heat-inducible transcriptional repressor
VELLEERRGLYVGGAAGLLEGARAEELESYQHLLEFLEKRATLLDVVSRALEPRRPFVRVGPELDHPALERLSLVGAAYGLANRTLGVVSLLGPVRMDYERAIRSVRGAANELSRFVAEIYEEN